MSLRDVQQHIKGVKVVQRDHTRDAETIRTIDAAVRANDLAKAVELSRSALDDGLLHPLPLNLRSYWHDQNGRQMEALDDLALAVRIAPRDLLVRNAYAMLLGRKARWSEAEDVITEAIAISSDFAPAHFVLGWIKSSTGQLALAREHFERAVTIDPSFADAHAQLASLSYRRADWVAARIYAERALAEVPRHYVARTVLANTFIATGELERADALLSMLPESRGIEPNAVADARAALGDLRDAQGQYAEAFDAYSRRNADKYRDNREQFEKKGNTAADYVHWLTEYFAAGPHPEWSTRARGDAVPADPRDGATGHVFLVGFPRSGTTLAENVLASHPGMCALDERDTLGEAARTFLTDDASRERLSDLSPAQIAEHRAIYWQRVRDFGADVRGKVFVDKYPLTSIKLPLVAKLFPDARILFAVRDPRDVVLSCFRRSFAMNTSMFELLDLERGARFYAAVMGLSALYREIFELAWHELRYESFVADFENEARRLCSFIGVEYNPQMADFAELAKSREIKTPSSIQVVRGLYGEGAGQWRNYAAQLAPAMPILKPWIERFGYDPE